MILYLGLLSREKKKKKIKINNSKEETSFIINFTLLNKNII
jgi:hypothetical protein